MIPGESQVGLVACACRDDHTTLECRKSGIILVLMEIFLFSGIFLPYLTVLIINYWPPLLPLVSQTGGQPPASGVFAVCLIIAAFFGVPTFVLLYESINHRNVRNLWFVLKINKVGLVLILISISGLLVTICYPVGYTDVPNMFEWMLTVLYEHGIAASCILVGGALYQFGIAAIWWFLPDTTPRDKYIKLGFIITYIIFFFITVYPLPAYIVEEFGPNVIDFARFKATVYDLPRKYSVKYIICAVCEYSLCILGALNFITHYKDLQRISCRLVLRHKSCQEEIPVPVPSISLKVIP